MTIFTFYLPTNKQSNGNKNFFIMAYFYQVEYKPEKLSNNNYTQHKVYHIKTEKNHIMMEV